VLDEGHELVSGGGVCCARGAAARASRDAGARVGVSVFFDGALLVDTLRDEVSPTTASVS
jgi:hypothetical protein